MMLARMSGIYINDKQPKQAPPKPLVELTEEEEIDPENWKKYEEKKKEQEQEQERAMIAKKEEAASEGCERGSTFSQKRPR
jgi:hypothetical protein